MSTLNENVLFDLSFMHKIVMIFQASTSLHEVLMVVKKFSGIYLCLITFELFQLFAEYLFESLMTGGLSN